MKLLSIWDFGVLELLGLSAVFLAIAGILFSQALKESKQRTAKQVRPLPGQPIPDTDGAPIKIYNLWTFRLACITILLWFATLYSISRSYAKGKNRAPVEKLNDGREAAEDQIKK